MNCPICGSNMLPSKKKFACSNKECGFTVYRSMGMDIKLDDNTIEILISKGNTEWIPYNANGKENFIRFFINGNKVAKEFKFTFLNGKCPVCGGAVMVNSKGYACANRINKNGCDFQIPGILSHRKITASEAEDFLKGKNIVLDGFLNGNDKSFSGILQFNEEKGVVFVDPVVGKCPLCGGKIYVGSSFYACENFKNEQHKCSFKVFREISHHSVTVEELRQICENGATNGKLVFFKEDGNTFRAKLALAENGKTIFI